MPQWMKMPNLASANHCMRAALAAWAPVSPATVVVSAANTGVARPNNAHANAPTRIFFMSCSCRQLLRNPLDRGAQPLQRGLDRHLDRAAFDVGNRQRTGGGAMTKDRRGKIGDCVDIAARQHRIALRADGIGLGDETLAFLQGACSVHERKPVLAYLVALECKQDRARSGTRQGQPVPTRTTKPRSSGGSMRAITTIWSPEATARWHGCSTSRASRCITGSAASTSDFTRGRSIPSRNRRLVSA